MTPRRADSIEPCRVIFTRVLEHSNSITFDNGRTSCPRECLFSECAHGRNGSALTVVDFGRGTHCYVIIFRFIFLERHQDRQCKSA
jgi:hypothetical protein